MATRHSPSFPLPRSLALAQRLALRLAVKVDARGWWLAAVLARHAARHALCGSRGGRQRRAVAGDVRACKEGGARVHMHTHVCTYVCVPVCVLGRRWAWRDICGAGSQIQWAAGCQWVGGPS